MKLEYMVETIMKIWGKGKNDSCSLLSKEEAEIYSNLIRIFSMIFLCY